ncbi:MAG: InlB B-repeat-containing protein [Clostridium sp.]
MKKIRRKLSLLSLSILTLSLYNPINIYAVSNNKDNDSKINLSTNVVTDENYSIDLSWNDITDDNERYYYRLLKSKENGDWESISTWNGEKVRVLNVYPIIRGENYVKDWMTNTISNSEEPAGMGLFEIDTVYIDDYNNNPDLYLKDDEGNYKYDVLCFGTYDSNNSKDLSDLSKEATQSFIDSGRGVLFGHDTLCLVKPREYHPNFTTFSEQLGIIVTGDDYRRDSTSVEVIDSGFLTSYPWKISGTLTIPKTHVWGQYAGGTLSGKVWMKLNGIEYDTDEATGATKDFYLVTNNQLAMIQTGHSNGQATDDERKVFANTLFYLKQTTNKTNIKDTSFYDEASPEKPSVKLSLKENVEGNTKAVAEINSEDIGTNYKYYVEAMAKSNANNNTSSNIVESTALSGIKGYVVSINENPDKMPELIQYDEDGKTVSSVISAENGKLNYDLTNLEFGKKYYLHVYAIDNENNVSDEMISDIDVDSMINNAEVSTKISTDKEEYFTLDNIVISAEASTNISKYMTVGKIEIYDENNNLVSTIADNLKETLTSEEKWKNQFNWVANKETIGNYTAEISWYFNDKLLAMDKTKFSVSLKKYNVNFVDYDGTVLDTQIVEDGKDAVAPKNPEREGNEKYTYKFVGWDVDFRNVTSDLTVKAIYNEKINKFNVKFVDYNDEVIEEQEVEYGKNAIAPNSPKRKETEKYTYEFIGWNVDFNNVTLDLIVKANYKEIEKEIKKATETPKVTESNKKKESPKAPVVSSETPKSGDNTNVIVLGFITIISAIIMLLSKFFANKSKRY